MQGFVVFIQGLPLNCDFWNGVHGVDESVISSRTRDVDLFTSMARIFCTTKSKTQIFSTPSRVTPPDPRPEGRGPEAVFRFLGSGVDSRGKKGRKGSEGRELGSGVRLEI